MQTICRWMPRVALLGISLLLSGCARQAVKLERYSFNERADFENSNLYNIDKMFEKVQSPAGGVPDYYFVIIGDTRNMARSYDLDGFNYMAKQIFYSRNESDSAYIYDKIAFVLWNGDMVYDGSRKEQWDNLKKAMSEKDYPEKNYPYIKILAKTKPFFPVLGNHELFHFRLKMESTYRDMGSSPVGLERFREFINWDGFAASPHILAPVPAEIGAPTFDKLAARLGSSADGDYLRGHYTLQTDGIYRITIFQEALAAIRQGSPPGSESSLMERLGKNRTAAELSRIFNTLGYSTVPVLSSDNMICYAFEIGDIVYLVLDSMSRGWHYRTFAEIKRALYPDKKDQHRLNLFSRSDLNGQYGFFQAVSAYVKSQGKKLVPIMHHSALNSSDNIDGGGLPYNLKLMLGVEHRQKDGEVVFDPQIAGGTFFDDLMFFNGGRTGEDAYLQQMFTSCVHYYQKFAVEPLSEGSPVGGFTWYISGGGGGELSKSYDHVTSYWDDRRLFYSENLYNLKLRQIDGAPGTGDAAAPRAIEIKDSQVISQYNFLIVHVKGNTVVSVYPHMAAKDQVHVRKSPFLTNPRIQLVGSGDPASGASLIGLDILDLGLEGLGNMFSWLSWNPSFSLGYLNYDTAGDMKSIGIASLHPVEFTLFFPRAQYRLTLLGFRSIFENKHSGRAFMTFGVEAPLLWNFFGLTRKVTLQLHYLVPFRKRAGTDPGFGGDMRWSFGLGYVFDSP